MTFNRFNAGVIIRVLLLFGTLLLLVYCIFELKNNYIIGSLGVFTALLLVELVNFVSKTNNELAKFIMAVKYTDFSYHFNEREAPQSFKELRHAFNEVHDTFRQLRFEKETHHQYLQTIIEFIDTGILSFDTTGEVEMMNQSFKKMLNVPYLKNIKTLQKKNETLYQAITTLKVGEQKLLRLDINQNTLKLMLSATTFKAHGKKFMLIAFQNVSSALEENETATWQKLLRVMTHEIMNSVAPIASLSDTLVKRLHQSEDLIMVDTAGDMVDGDAVRDVFEDVALGVEVIHKRSEGLLKFAETYRNMSKISDPVLSDVTAKELFETIQKLMQTDLEKKNIELKISVVPPHLLLQVDARLIEQVLINLVLNAAEAVKNREKPVVKLVGKLGENGRPILEVIDNGIGIPPSLAENIFIPFFTTNKNGSGIGLSLSKQIMQLHKGSIQMQSVENEGTVFSLRF
ncbi:ATP-binding protein [Rhodocytophaga aerolata]|uniref:histidine kinase n=1 Tax=Rhodocytophaga aerolata TaxID=455078 RepID=A0ABT8RAH3_9BACT|nr:ATP-binding protein [Rhodocytophaga aerolata]MDO1449099.1 ATP-binding protein [Rhodocytophaga aerolata]